jgi:uncharacterized protein YdeI (YjbR/CyaY-like superfamily)
MAELQHIYINNLADLADWLEVNWSQKDSVWLVYYKKSSEKADFSISEIIDVLLRYGWVDSLPNKFDEERTKLRISPRNPKSNWSRVNKEKVARLIEQGLMHENGLKLIEIAKQNGCWDALNDVENLVLPDDFEQELSKQGLISDWEKLPRSSKRGFLEALLNAKKQETRDRRIATFIETMTTLRG